MAREIKEGAIFIADAHENKKRIYFKNFLDKLKNHEIPLPPQIFLMGDIFDVLVGGIKYTEVLAKEYINELEELAKKCEIYYFEGNHDFNLGCIFSRVKIIPIESQPMRFSSPYGDILLLHGDKFVNFIDGNFMKFLRSKGLIKILNFINEAFKSSILKKLLMNLERKCICKKISNFEEIINKRIIYFDLKNVIYVIEGHYHQGVSFELNNVIYLNLDSFACNQSYFVVQFTEDIKFYPIKEKKKGVIDV